jgi:hypothetical protein
MKFSKNRTSNILTDKVAFLLASLIINMQIRSSAWLNQRFNACSTQTKKRLIIAIGLLSTILLVAGSFCSFYTIPKLSQNYSSVHIGLPSDIPKAHFTERHLTDSLNKKK